MKTVEDYWQSASKKYDNYPEFVKEEFKKVFYHGAASVQEIHLKIQKISDEVEREQAYKKLDSEIIDYMLSELRIAIKKDPIKIIESLLEAAKEIRKENV